MNQLRKTVEGTPRILEVKLITIDNLVLELIDIGEVTQHEHRNQSVKAKRTQGKLSKLFTITIYRN